MEFLRNILETIFPFLPLVAIVGMVAIRFTKDKDVIRISWDKLAQWTAFLVILAIFRLLQYDFLLNAGALRGIPTIPPMIDMEKWTLGLVFWEDMFFGVPLYYIWKYMNRKWLQIALTLIISAVFAYGHAYQGITGVIWAAFLPYYVSYNVGKRYGFGTSMLGHIMYDVSTVYLIKLLPYLL
jgi:hypothetical protein